jgi:hypothetical protein
VAGRARDAPAGQQLKLWAGGGVLGVVASAGSVPRTPRRRRRRLRTPLAGRQWRVVPGGAGDRRGRRGPGGWGPEGVDGAGPHQASKQTSFQRRGHHGRPAQTARPRRPDCPGGRPSPVLCEPGGARGAAWPEVSGRARAIKGASTTPAGAHGLTTGRVFWWSMMVVVVEEPPRSTTWIGNAKRWSSVGRVGRSARRQHWTPALAGVTTGAGTDTPARRKPTPPTAARFPGASATGTIPPSPPRPDWPPRSTTRATAGASTPSGFPRPGSSPRIQRRS